MDRKEADRQREKESERVLDKVAAESEVFGTSSFVRTANKAKDHLSGSDGDQSDKVEVWGKRVGRALSVIVFFALVIWLYNFLTRGA